MKMFRTVHPAASAVIRRLRTKFSGSAGRQSLCAMLSQALTSGANFATTVLVLRALGFEGFGQFSVCFLLVMIARNYLNGLVLVPMSTIGPKLVGRGAARYRGFLLANLVGFWGLSTLVLAVTCFPLSVALDSTWLIALIPSLLLLNLCANAADFIRRHHFMINQPVRALMVDVVRFSTQLLAIILLMMDDNRAWLNVSTTLGAIALGGGAGALWGFASFGRPRWSKRFTRAVWPRHAAFVRWMSLTVTLEAIQGNAPLFVIAALLGESALGFLRAVQSLANTLNLPFNAMQQIAPSLASEAFRRGGTKAMRHVITQLTVGALFILLGTCVLVLAMWTPIIEVVFDIDPAIALPIFLAYCLCNIGLVLRLTLIVTLQVMERPSVLATANFVGSIIAIAASFSLVSFIGPLSVPIVNILIVIVTTMIFYIYILRGVKN